MNFDPSETEQTVEIDILNDAVYELSEEFRGQISLPQGSVGVSIRDGASITTITIDDEDCEFCIPFS